MMRQYGAQRCRGGSNPLRVSTVAVGTVVYLQDEGVLRSRFGEAPVCRTPWMVEAFLNGMLHAARRDPLTGTWRSSYWSGRSDTAVIRSLRDGRRETVAVRTVLLHEELGLTKGVPAYPTLPDLRFYRAPRTTPAKVAAAA